jgi:hypothetical protein
MEEKLVYRSERGGFFDGNAVSFFDEDVVSLVIVVW